jgi:Arc/MetJ family transcription regulator
MKTTIDIDEKKLMSLMRTAGIKTRKAAVDYALSCAERMVRLRAVLANPLPDTEYTDALDPAYDVMALREHDKPEYGRHVDG